MFLTPQYFNVRFPIHPTIQDYPKIRASRTIFNILSVKLAYGQLKPGSLREDYGLRPLGIDIYAPFVCDVEQPSVQIEHSYSCDKCICHLLKQKVLFEQTAVYPMYINYIATEIT